MQHKFVAWSTSYYHVALAAPNRLDELLMTVILWNVPSNQGVDMWDDSDRAASLPRDTIWLSIYLDGVLHLLSLTHSHTNILAVT